MEIRRFMAASVLILGLSFITGLGTKAQNIAQRQEGITTSLKTIDKQDISLEQANIVINKARAKAIALKTKMDIAVVDVGGNLKAFARMDGACLGCIDIAIRKARTARLFDRPTGELGKLSQPGGPLYAIEHSNGGLITFPGGLPLQNSQGNIVGAIGVSGDTVDNDHLVAQAGANAITQQK